jgi:hypothetical protein
MLPWSQRAEGTLKGLGVSQQFATEGLGDRRLVENFNEINRLGALPWLRTKGSWVRFLPAAPEKQETDQRVRCHKRLTRFSLCATLCATSARPSRPLPVDHPQQRGAVASLVRLVGRLHQARDAATDRSVGIDLGALGDQPSFGFLMRSETALKAFTAVKFVDSPPALCVLVEAGFCWSANRAQAPARPRLCDSRPRARAFGGQDARRHRRPAHGPQAADRWACSAILLGVGGAAGHRAERHQGWATTRRRTRCPESPGSNWRRRALS